MNNLEVQIRIIVSEKNKKQTFNKYRYVRVFISSSNKNCSEFIFKI